LTVCCLLRIGGGVCGRVGSLGCGRIAIAVSGLSFLLAFAAGAVVDFCADIASDSDGFVCLDFNGKAEERRQMLDKIVGVDREQGLLRCCFEVDQFAVGERRGVVGVDQTYEDAFGEEELFLVFEAQRN